MENSKGYIYIIESEYGSKIGLAEDYWLRFLAIQSSCPIELKLKRVFSVYNVEKAEMGLHRFCSDKKIRGEWFNINDEDIKNIENYLKYNQYLFRIIDVKKKKVLKREEIYETPLFSIVKPENFTTTNELYLMTEINNLRKENGKLRNEIEKLRRENHKLKMK